VISCTSSSCDCSGAGSLFSSGCTLNTTSFNALVTRMQSASGSTISAANLVVEYRGSGLGYAGDASCSAGGSCMQISPLVSVRLRNLTYQPLTLEIFGAAVPIPSSPRRCRWKTAAAPTRIRTAMTMGRADHPFSIVPDLQAKRGPGSWR
jgi:hypothetical protein